MMLSLRTIIGAFAIVLSFASASTSFSATDFEITQLVTHLSNVNGNATDSGNDVDLSFVVRDPDSLANSSAVCSGAWKLNGTYPTGAYVSCSNATFGWNIVDDSFKNIYTFTLQLKNTFVDPSVGEYPYDEVTNFAKARISSNETTCSVIHSGVHKGDYSCHQKSNTTIEAPIWASIAK